MLCHHTLYTTLSNYNGVTYIGLGYIAHQIADLNLCYTCITSIGVDVLL